MSSAVVSPTPSDLINFLKLSRIILEDVPDVLRSLLDQKISPQKGKKMNNNAKWGKWFLQGERFTLKLLKNQKQMIEKGLIQNWDLTLLFHALLYSSHFLLADSIPGQQLSVTYNSRKATTPLKVSLTHSIRSGDFIILDFGGSDFIKAEVTNVRPTEILFKRPLRLPSSLPSLYVNAYLCSTMWCAVQDLSFIRNDEFAHRISARITEQQLLNVVQRIENNYKSLGVEPSRISFLQKIRAEHIAESSIAEKVEHYREMWMKECKHSEDIMKCFENIQTDVAIMKEKEIPGIKKTNQETKDQVKQLSERVFALENNASSIEPNPGHLIEVPINPGFDELQHQIDKDEPLNHISHLLMHEYDLLFVTVKKSLKKDLLLEDGKDLIRQSLQRKKRVRKELTSCIDALNETCDFKSFFDFLEKFYFIGYLNYILLKKLYRLIACKDKVNQCFVKYETLYAKFLKAITCKDLIKFFEQNSEKALTVPLGLPCVTFCIEESASSSASACVSKLNELSWMESVFLKQLQDKCIIITYAILPCVLDDVMRDLKDPVILKKLKDKGVTVFKLPQEEEEDFDDKEEGTLLREEDIEFTTATEKSVPDYDAAPNEEVNKLIEAIQNNSIHNVTSLLMNGADPNVSEFQFGGPSALFVATKENNIDIVELLLENGADPNLDCNTFHGTALHYASETNNADMVNLLLTKGKANVNALDKRNRTPLFNAVESGSTKAVDILLTNGARTDIVDTLNGTPLQYASKTDIAEVLLAKGNVDVNTVDNFNRTPLFNAVESGNIITVKSLLKAGAKTDVVNKGGETLLHCAGTFGRAETLEVLIKKGVSDVNAFDKRNRTPLFNAVESGSIEAVKILLKAEAKTDVVDEGGETLLHCAGTSGKFEMLRFWIKKRVTDVIALDKRNRTPLFNAVESGSIEAVNILLANGARTDVMDAGGETLLHCAVESGKVEMLKILLDKGAEIHLNASDKRNRTPLFNAVESGSIEAVEFLIDNGAEIDVVDEDDEILLHCAGKSGKVKMLRFLMDKGVIGINASDKRNRTPLFNAVESGSIEAVKFLIKNGAKIDVVDEVGETLLHCAGKSGKVKMLRFLIDKKVTGINASDKRNRTPLFNAVESDSIKAVDFLLSNGARTDVVSQDGETLLHCAGQSGKVEMLEFWIKRGEYDVNVKDKWNRTPLFNAVMSGSIEAVDILLTNRARTDVEDKVRNLYLLAISRGEKTM